MMPRNISHRWIAQKRTLLNHTAKTIDGQPNPNYVRLESEIAEAEKELARHSNFVAWVKATYGMKLNEYPIRFRCHTHDCGTVFAKKADGKWTILSKEAAYGEYQKSLEAQS